MQHSHPPFVGIAGNIGVGKTTFTEIIAERFGWQAYYESVIDNPYLSDFYGNMKRWSFNLQIFFLHHRFATHIEMSKNTSGAIQDRTIYEDIEIFARNLFDMGLMSKRDWQTYSDLFKNMTSFLKKPDLIIYLKASTDTLMSRINSRDRDFERNINPEYLHSLNISYDNWISNLKEIPVYVIESDHFNIFEEPEKLDLYCNEIQIKLDELN
jgi:deoxyadenosine/deoxycytidine kinase